MKIFEAKKRVMRLRIVATIIMAISALFIICGAMKGIYAGVAGDASPFQFLSQGIQKAVFFVYERTQIISWIWKFAPTLNPQQFNSPGTLGFLFVTCCGAIGRVMWNSASHLANRIAKTIQRIEELGWEQALLKQQGLLTSVNADVLQISIELEQKDQWYKRPIGLVFIGVAIAVIAQLVNLKFGFIK